MNSRKKPDCLADAAKKSFQACFVREGVQKNRAKNGDIPKKLGLLAYANDWKLVDFEDRKMVFPPLICATSLTPDIVIWSKMSRSVILIELTCCAEEGINAAQQRKETRYAELMEQINLTNWKASLLTLEIGARGLVGSRTYHALVSLGILSTKVKAGLP